ncbi:hypothetical protein FA95DRAFT_1557143 [Auriscalpium vulgare]|uniref:Uncharacterized protein n=1 Tax=Auriscalpium vulgare TaxID=40419 RepID=A0ACB8S033_9AGAM|nr:hypothetical protein FA95DRAFT_1557143 [Auriscalpium vulgare]
MTCTDGQSRIPLTLLDETPVFCDGNPTPGRRVIVTGELLGTAAPFQRNGRENAGYATTTRAVASNSLTAWPRGCHSAFRGIECPQPGLLSNPILSYPATPH